MTPWTEQEAASLYGVLLAADPRHTPSSLTAGQARTAYWAGRLAQHDVDPTWAINTAARYYDDPDQPMLTLGILLAKWRERERVRAINAPREPIDQMLAGIPATPPPWFREAVAASAAAARTVRKRYRPGQPVPRAVMEAATGAAVDKVQRQYHERNDG